MVTDPPEKRRAKDDGGADHKRMKPVQDAAHPPAKSATAVLKAAVEILPKHSSATRIIYLSDSEDDSTKKAPSRRGKPGADSIATVTPCAKADTTARVAEQMPTKTALNDNRIEAPSSSPTAVEIARRAPKNSEKQLCASEVITLKVGPAAEVIAVHEKVLRQSSRFFQTTLSSKRARGDFGGTVMPEGTFECISTYVQWLYVHRVPRTLPHTPNGHHGYRYESLVQAYILGHRIEDDQYCDAILTAMAIAVDSGISPSADFIQHLYMATSKETGSPMRDFLASVYADRGAGAWIRNGQFPHQFLLDLSFKLLDRPRSVPVSYYAIRNHWFKQKLS